MMLWKYVFVLLILNTITSDQEQALPFHSFAMPSTLTLFLCGDVMTGRGIDQVLPYSVDPKIYEAYVKNAKDYVRLAERKNGSIPQPVSYTYIWGDALQVWQQVEPDLKLINLETSITEQPEPWPGKEVQYRMHPNNVEVLTAAGIDFCSLANNHTMDWGRAGLLETLQTLSNANIAFAGAGENKAVASTPAILNTAKGRVVILAYGSETSGVYRSWAATENEPGVNLLPDMSDATVQMISEQVTQVKRAGDVVVLSIHWGSNWGYDVPPVQQRFAHQLIDKAGIDLVFGHSSHHPRGIEVYNGKLIIYGAGDFINDYEGISSHEQYRGDLSLMYFPKLDPATGKLLSLLMVPMQIKNFRLSYTSRQDARWLADVLDKESEAFGSGVALQKDGSYLLTW